MGNYMLHEQLFNSTDHKDSTKDEELIKFT